MPDEVVPCVTGLVGDGDSAACTPFLCDSVPSDSKGQKRTHEQLLMVYYLIDMVAQITDLCKPL